MAEYFNLDAIIFYFYAELMQLDEELCGIDREFEG